MFHLFLENQENPVVVRQETFILNPKKVLSILSYLIIFLVLLSVTGQWFHFTFDLQERVRYSQLTSFLNVNDERNLPTFFSSIILLISSILLCFITYSEVQKERNRKYYKFSWFFLAIIFLYLSIDEYAAIHERLTPEMRGLGTFTSWFYYAWVIPAMIGVTILGLFFLKFVIYLPYKTRNQFVVSGILYVGGALGMELVSSRYTYYYGKENLNYSLLTTIEETMEMFGIAYFIYALLCYIQEYVQNEMTIKLKS